MFVKSRSGENPTFRVLIVCRVSSSKGIILKYIRIVLIYEWKYDLSHFKLILIDDLYGE